MRTNLVDYLLDGGLKKSPDSEWVSDPEVSWTFRHFNHLTERIGTALGMLGASSGSVVIVFMPNSAPMLATDFGTLRAGAAFMNLDVMLPSARLQALLEKVAPDFIVTTDEHLPRLPNEHHSKVVKYDEIILVEPNDPLLKQRREYSIDTDPACLIMTSGSTGTPKAVALSHRGLIDFGDWFDKQFNFQPNDVVGSLSPLFFDGYIPGLLMSLLHGGRFVILAKEVAAFPVNLAKQLEKLEISFIFWVPSTLTPLASLRILDDIPLPKLKFIGFAGEVMPPATLQYLRQKLPHAVFINFYGPVEISVICTFYEVPPDFPVDHPIPLGRPCANTRILLLNDEDKPCHTDEQGELCVVGSSLAIGYWNDTERTREAFSPNPLITTHNEIIYRTGDIAKRDSNGYLHYIGRRDFQIKHQGYRINLEEIDHVANNLLHVLNCHAVYSQSKHQIVLFYENREEIALLEVRKRLSDHLPKHMLPARIVRLESTPLSPNGKTDRRELERISNELN